MSWWETKVSECADALMGLDWEVMTYFERQEAIKAVLRKYL